MSKRFLRLFTPDSLVHSLKVYLSTNVVIRALGIGRGILLTWLMSRADFGTYQLGLLLANLLLPLLSLGLHDGFIRFVPEHETQGRLGKFVKLALPFSLTVGIGLCVLMFLFYQPVSSLIFGSPTASGRSSSVDYTALTRLVALCVAALIVYHLILAFLRGRRMFQAVSLMELSASVVFTLSAVLAAFSGRSSGVVILSIYTAANLLCAVLFGVPALWGLARESQIGDIEETSVSLPALVKYSIWAGLATLCWQLLLLYPAWHLQRVCGEEIFATFSAMRILTQLAHIAPVAMSAVVISAVTKNWESAGREAALSQLNLATKGAIAVVLLPCLILAMLKGLVIFLFRIEYVDGEEVIPPLLLFYLLAGALGFMVIRFSLIKKSQWVFVSWVAGCVVAVAVSYACIDAGDPVRALINTGWASVAGVSGALALTLGLLCYCQLLPDRGTLILLAGIFLLVSKVWLLITGFVAVILVASMTSLIFTSQERQALLQQAGKLLRGEYPSESST